MAVLLITFLLLALSEAIYTSYIILVNNTVFVTYVTTASWLKDMSAHVRGAVAVVVGISGLLQLLVLSWRALAR